MKKKKRKKSERNQSSSSSQEDEEDLDKILLKKYKAAFSQNSKKDSSFVDKKYYALTKELDKIVKTKKTKHRRSPSTSPAPRRDIRPSRHSRERDADDNYSKRRRSRSTDYKHRNISPPQSNHSREAKSYGLITADGKKIELKSKNDVKWYSKSELKEKTASSSAKDKDHHKRNDSRKMRLTEEEMERKRLEMMENATWRERDREDTVKRYRKTQKEEEVIKDYDVHFLDRHLKKAHEQASSIETRIKSNLNNIQRSKSTMDMNFAKR